MTKQEFAAVLGCSWHSVSSWEVERRFPGEDFDDKLDRLDRKVRALDRKAIRKVVPSLDISALKG